MRLPALLLVALVAGCGQEGDPPEKVVQFYLQADDAAACEHLTAAPDTLCQRPHVPEPGAAQVVIDGVYIDDDQATVRASYAWTGYRRHSTFTLVRRGDDWLIARETPD